MRLHHVQISIPAGGEVTARAFYGDLLGLPEVAKPPLLQGRGGVWFRYPADGGTGGVELHVGVEADFAPARKAHPAFEVDNLDALAARVAAAGHPVTWDDAIPGTRRFHTVDGHGNRVELQAPALAPAADAEGAETAAAPETPTRLRLTSVTIGSDDPHRLAAFYAALLGTTITALDPIEADGTGGWAQLRAPSGPTINIEYEAHFVAPTWPSEPGVQTATQHLDIHVEDLAAATAWAQRCGATLASVQPQPEVRVLLDPSGHPFCLFT